MKKIIFPLIACMMAACADLDYTDVTTNDEEWIYNSPIYGVDKLASDVYACVMDEFERSYNGAWRASATDEADFTDLNSSVHVFTNGGWSANNPMPEFWKNNYTGVHEANNFLEKLDKIDLTDYIYSTAEQTDFATLKARFDRYPYEMRALRAYFYFELARTYGDVPLVTKTLSIDEANNVSRTPVEEVFQFIISECDAIAEYLPANYMNEPGQQWGRASRPFVMALKARTLLYRASPLFNPQNDLAKWREAAEANKYVIDHASEWGISIGKYADLWGNDSFTTAEFIWGLAHSESNYFEQVNYPVGIEGGKGGNCPTQSLIDMYEYQIGSNQGKTFGEVNPGTVDATDNSVYANLDPRFAMTIVKNGDMWPLCSNQKLKMETFEGGYNASPNYHATTTGYYLRKFVNGNTDLTPNVNSRFRHNSIFMRLAEFYYNYAECIYAITGSADNGGEYGLSANEAINVVRGRVDVQMPPFTGNPTDFRERYERERAVEFAFEDQRFWDVRRWGKGEQYFAKVYGANLTKDTTGKVTLTRSELSRHWDNAYNLFPIPYSEIKKNPKLTQNPGW